MELFFRKEGEGNPLVILHGLFGSSDNWMSIGRNLAKNFTVYLPDQRNHGLSPNTDAFDYDTMAADLLQLLDDQGLEAPIIMGHSMGGKVAMRFAEQHPDRLAALVVVDIAPRFYPVHHQVILEGLNAVKPWEIKSRKEADERLSAHVKELGVRQFLLKNLYRTDSGGFDWRINLPVISEKIGNVGAPIQMEQPFKKRTAFIRGANSQYITTADEAEILTKFPQATIRTIEKAGHWVHAEQPKAFVAAFTDFVNS